MSDPDRRSDRQGPERPLAFDKQRRKKPRGPVPVTLILSVLLLVVVAGGVAYMYRSGPRGANDAPQPLGTPLRDVRAPAEPQAKAPEPGDGLTISKDEPAGASDKAGAPPTFAPPPEEPVTRPSGPAATPPPPPPPEGSETPARTQAEDDKSDPIGRQIAKADRRPGAPAPAARADKAETHVGRDEGGPVVVQIGAFSSARLADKEWSNAAAVAPGAMAGKGKRVVAVNKDGETLYRTAITGFANRDQALALCDRLRDAGGHCFVR
jgi:cell division protein FtsN